MRKTQISIKIKVANKNEGVLRSMDANTFRQKIEGLDEAHWQILLGGFLGRTDVELAKANYMTQQNVRKHFSRIYKHFEITPTKGKKRPRLYALMVRHKAELIEFLSDWDDVNLLLRLYNILGRMKRSEKLKLIKKSDSQLIDFLAQSLS